jgi:L-lactate permease
MGALTLFLKLWHPKHVWTSTSREGETVSYAEAEAGAVRHGFARAQIIKAWDAVGDPERARISCGDSRKSRRS